MFGIRKRIKRLEQRVKELEKMQIVPSWHYGDVTLSDVVKIIDSKFYDNEKLKKTAGKTDGEFEPKIEIIINNADNVPYRVELKLSMAYHDWCKFEKSRVYQSLKKYVDIRGKQSNRMRNQVKQE